MFNVCPRFIHSICCQNKLLSFGKLTSYRSAVVGYGTPLPERLSTGVLIIIIVGFGTPILLIILAVVYVIARKLRVKKAASSYSIIN